MRTSACLLLLCCGGEGARFEMSFSALSLPDVAQLQVSVLSDRKTIDCDAVTKGCVKAQFPSTRFVALTDAAGAAHTAVRFAPDAGTLVVGMSPGRDFAFVIEALSPASPPQLAGSSCTYVQEITAGSNVVAASLTLVGDAGVISDCDPTLN